MFEQNKKALKELFEYGSMPYSNRQGIFLEDFDINNINFKELEDYNIRLQMSKNLQQDSNIVIIDPDISTVDELAARFDSYNKLIYKFRIYCNNYSYQIWGYDVSTMYYKVLSDIQTDEHVVDPNNVVVKESAKNKDNLYYECVMASSDYLQFEKAKLFAEVDSTLPNKPVLEELEISISRLCPWFTVTEMQDMNQQFKFSDKYYKAIVENLGNKDNLLEIGWNPELQVNEYSDNVASSRQKKWFNEYGVRIFDFTNEELEIENPKNNAEHGLLPIFMVTPYELPKEAKDLFNEFYISFTPDLRALYAVECNDKNIRFRKELRTILQNKSFKLSVVFFEKEVYKELSSIIAAGQQVDISTDTVLDQIYNNYDQIDTTNNRIASTIYTVFLFRLTKDTKLCNNPSCYDLYAGSINDFVPGDVDLKMGLFFDKDVAAKYSASTFHNFAESCSDKKKLANAIRTFMNEVCVPTPVCKKIVVPVKVEDEFKLI